MNKTKNDKIKEKKIKPEGILVRNKDIRMKVRKEKTTSRICKAESGETLLVKGTHCYLVRRGI